MHADLSFCVYIQANALRTVSNKIDLVTSSGKIELFDFYFFRFGWIHSRTSGIYKSDKRRNNKKSNNNASKPRAISEDVADAILSMLAHSNNIMMEYVEIYNWRKLKSVNDSIVAGDIN